jgi:hypothetical protein
MDCCSAEHYPLLNTEKQIRPTSKAGFSYSINPNYVALEIKSAVTRQTIIPFLLVNFLKLTFMLGKWKSKYFRFYAL